MKINSIPFLCAALAATLACTTQCSTSRSDDNANIKAPADASLNGTLMTFTNGIFSSADFGNEDDTDGIGNDISGPSGKLPEGSSAPFFSSEWKYTRFENNTFTAMREDYSVLGYGTYTNKVEGTNGESTILELTFTNTLDTSLNGVVHSYSGLKLYGALSRLSYRDVYSGICSYTETVKSETSATSYPRSYRFTNAVVTLVNVGQ